MKDSIILFILPKKFLKKSLSNIFGAQRLNKKNTIEYFNKLFNIYINIK